MSHDRLICYLKKKSWLLSSLRNYSYPFSNKTIYLWFSTAGTSSNGGNFSFLYWKVPLVNGLKTKLYVYEIVWIEQQIERRKQHKMCLLHDNIKWPKKNKHICFKTLQISNTLKKALLSFCKIDTINWTDLFYHSAP